MTQSRKVLYLRPRDKSLEAFKDWIQALMLHLTGEKRETMSEEQWTAYWQKFWAAGDAQNDEK